MFGTLSEYWECGTLGEWWKGRDFADVWWIAQNYRYWVLWRCPHVRFLDYRKVKDAERKRAVELFGTAAEPSALAAKVRHSSSGPRKQASCPLSFYLSASCPVLPKNRPHLAFRMQLTTLYRTR